MQFQEVVHSRRMVRRFTSDLVPPTILDRILRAAVQAPSAGFTQAWSFLILETEPDRQRYWRATTPVDSTPNTWLDGMKTAPVLIVVFTSKAAYLSRYAQPDKGWTNQDEDRWPIPYWYVDAGMSSMLILATATDEGLGACFFGIGASEVPRFRAEFDVPEDWMIAGVIALGHPATGGSAGSPSRRSKKSFDQVIHRGTINRKTVNP